MLADAPSSGGTVPLPPPPPCDASSRDAGALPRPRPARTDAGASVEDAAEHRVVFEREIVGAFVNRRAAKIIQKAYKAHMTKKRAAAAAAKKGGKKK